MRKQKTKPSKSPFLIIPSITAEQCEQIILDMKIGVPDLDTNNVPLIDTQENKLLENRLFPIIDNVLDVAEGYYDFETKFIYPFKFVWRPEGTPGEYPKVDGAIKDANTWKKQYPLDFIMYLFLTTSDNSTLKDTLSGSIGGNLEFYNHALTIIPNAGNILMFPTNKHFLNNFTKVEYGNLCYVVVRIQATTPYKYESSKFPGNYYKWFSNNKATINNN